MKKVLFLILLLALVGGGLYYYQPELLRQYLPQEWCDAIHVPKQIPGSYIGRTLNASDWADIEEVQEKLRDSISSRLTGTSAEEVEIFLHNPENRLILAQYALTQAELLTADLRKQEESNYAKTLEALEEQLTLATQNKDEATMPERIQVSNAKLRKRIEAIQRETTNPHEIHEVIGTPEGISLLQILGNNLDWIEQFSATGEVTRPGVAMSILAKLVKKHPDIVYNQMERDIATATAIEFARQGWAQEDAVARAEFHIKSWKDGRLNKEFDSLPFWQRRIVCGLKGKGEALGGAHNDSAGSVESLQWSLDNVHLPAYRYTNACWQCDYRMHNIFGDHVESSGYYLPFEDNYGKKWNEFTYNVGGVCGALSHYGATSAVANGIPAITALEPGHCSYVVRVGDKWVPSYSLSWQRGMHWRVFSDTEKYSQLDIADKMFSPQQQPKTQLSQALRMLGQVYAEENPKKADSFFLHAIDTQPLNYYAWRDYAAFLQKTAASEQGIPQWKELCSKLNEKLTPVCPELAAELLKLHIYPTMKTAFAAKQDELRDILLSFWKHVKNMNADPEWDAGNNGRWNVEQLADNQLKTLGINPLKNPAVSDFIRDLVRSLNGNMQYTPAIFSWGSELAQKMPEKLRGDAMAAMIGGLNGASDDDLEKTLEPLIVSAEKMGDVRTFQTIGNALPEKYRKPGAREPMPELQPFPGTLVSQGGCIQPSSMCAYRISHPCSHWGVLEPGIGGHFQTTAETDPWVKVTLPKQAHLSGIVIVTTKDNRPRLSHMKVQISETGKDDDWHDVAEDLGKCKDQVIRVDLLASNPLAKYVRIVRKGGPAPFHLIGIFIYGTPAA